MRLELARPEQDPYAFAAQRVHAVLERRPGCEIDLQARGAHMAGAISALKARLRLAVAIATELPLEAAFPVN